MGEQRMQGRSMHEKREAGVSVGSGNIASRTSEGSGTDKGVKGRKQQQQQQQQRQPPQRGTKKQTPNGQEGSQVQGPPPAKGKTKHVAGTRTGTGPPTVPNK